MERYQVDRFIDSGADRQTLGLVYGRRRIGKSTMLVGQVEERKGFYFEATRTATPIQLERIGRALGTYLNTGRIAFGGWEEAITELLRLGERGVVPVVLDEFGYIIEADASVPSLLASALGPASRNSFKSETRFILCGSAMKMMRGLTGGQAPLRGRAGMELVMQADDYRVAATRLPASSELSMATQVFAVIGGIVGYATDMVDFDLPFSSADFDRWVVQRVLSPAATLHHEATTLLAEDPTTSGRGALLYHSMLGAIANGSVTAGTIAGKVGKQVPNINPALSQLIEAGFVVRHEDPIRSQRPLYALDDPFLQFHYAVLEPHGSLLRDRDPAQVWSDRLKDIFGSRVRGPVFGEQARTWVRRFASDETLAVRDYVGPSVASFDDRDWQVDLITTGSGDVPSERTITAIGEAKAVEMLNVSHLRHLERMRRSFGERASDAKLFLFGQNVDERLVKEAEVRADLEIVDTARLYRGS